MKNQRAFKICNEPRCNALTRSQEGYCDKHIGKHLQEVTERKRAYYKQYDNTREDKEIHSFYFTKEWKKLRYDFMSKHYGICGICGHGATTVHHIEPIKDNWNRRLDPTNLICVCDICHKAEHKKLDEIKSISKNRANGLNVSYING